MRTRAEMAGPISAAYWCHKPGCGEALYWAVDYCPFCGKKDPTASIPTKPRIVSLPDKVHSNDLSDSQRVAAQTSPDSVTMEARETHAPVNTDTVTTLSGANWKGILARLRVALGALAFIALCFVAYFSWHVYRPDGPQQLPNPPQPTEERTEFRCIFERSAACPPPTAEPAKR